MDNSLIDFFVKNLSEKMANRENWLWLRSELSPKLKERILAEAPESFAARILLDCGDVDNIVSQKDVNNKDIKEQNDTVAMPTFEDVDLAPLPDDDEDFIPTINTDSSPSAASETEDFDGRAVICWLSDEAIYAHTLENSVDLYVDNQPSKPLHLGNWIRYKSECLEGQLVIVNYQIVPPIYPTSLNGNGNSIEVYCEVTVPENESPPINNRITSQISRRTWDTRHLIKSIHYGETLYAKLLFCYDPSEPNGYWEIEQIFPTNGYDEDTSAEANEQNATKCHQRDSVNDSQDEGTLPIAQNTANPVYDDSWARVLDYWENGHGKMIDL